MAAPTRSGAKRAPRTRQPTKARSRWSESVSVPPRRMVMKWGSRSLGRINSSGQHQSALCSRARPTVGGPARSLPDSNCIDEIGQIDRSLRRCRRVLDNSFRYALGARRPRISTIERSGHLPPPKILAHADIMQPLTPDGDEAIAQSAPRPTSSPPHNRAAIIASATKRP